MGISGLTSFMNKEYLDDVLEDVKLKNCKLLIDGYSLLYQVHSSLSLQSSHGGNYDELANKLSEYLEALKKCNIEAIFLLDGGRDKLDRKFKTALNRANQRLQEACSLSTCALPIQNSKKNKNKISLEHLVNSGSYKIFSKLLPIMSSKIYIDLLKKYEFIHYQCCFEADYDLTCLANELKCPLLSCDSDFFVYDLKYGYIPFDYFDSTEINDPEQENSFYLTAKIYYIDKFVSFYNLRFDDLKETCLRKEMLAILAVLLGNDYVDKSTFSSLLSTFDSTNNNLKFKKLKRNLSGYAKRKVTFYNRLLDWLAQFESTQECLETILNFVKSDRHELIRKIVHESIQEYMCLKPSFAFYYKTQIDEIFNLKFNNLSIKESKNDLVLNSDITTFNGKILNDEILKIFFHCKLSRFCLDVLIHRKIIFNCQVEVPDLPSTYLSSMNIRKYYYTNLIKTFENDFESAQNDIVIKEYLRYQRDIKIFDVNLSSNNEFNINSKDHADKTDAKFLLKNLLKFDDKICFNLIDQNEFSNLSRKLKSLYSILYFWLNTGKQNEELKVLNELKNENFVRSFIVSVLKLSIIDPCYNAIKYLNYVPLGDNKEGIFVYEQKETSLLDEYFTTKQDLPNKFLTELKELVLSDSKNFCYIKEIRNRLANFSSLKNLNTNLVNKASFGKIEKLLDLKTVHCLCEFQAIYLSIGYVQNFLNILRFNPEDFIFLNLNYFFNGTFLHNFKEELEHRVNPDLYIEELFGRKSLFKTLYYELLQTYRKIFLTEPHQVEVENITIDQPQLFMGLSKNSKKNLKKNLKKKEKKILAQNSENK